MGYSRKNPNWGWGGGEWGYTFLTLPLEFFIFFTLPLEIPDKTKLKPLEIPENCVRSLGNSKVKTKFHIIIFFLITLGNSPLFLINPYKFHIEFLWNPWKFNILKHPPAPTTTDPCLDFFWNNPLNNRSLKVASWLLMSFYFFVP